MAWHIVLILDCEYPLKDLAAIARHVPVWAVMTPERDGAATSIRESAHAWYPERGLTLFRPANEDDQELTCSHTVETLLEHHPEVALLELMGIPPTPMLTAIMAASDFKDDAIGVSYGGLLFRRPVERLAGVRKLYLDAGLWCSSEDVFTSFFEAVGAPAFHGRNFNALNDSIVSGEINQIEVPYILVIKNFAAMGLAARKMADDFIALIQSFAMRGCPVAIRIEES